MLQNNFQLDPNKKIGIVSPSWNGPGKFRHVFDQGVRQLKEIFNKEVIYSKNSICEIKPSYQDRAEDINQMFSNDSVDFIIASIGGSDSINILPFLDINIIKKNSNHKIFMGFSDTTNLLVFLDMLGVQCIHGPSVMAGFAEPSGVSQELKTHINKLFTTSLPYYYKDFSITTDIDPNWYDKVLFEKEKTKYFNYSGWDVVQSGDAEGRLWGGNLETLNKLFESNFFPFETQNWDQTILFLETSEEKPSLGVIIGFLDKLKDRGILKEIRALIFGQFPYYNDIEKKEIKQGIKNFFKENIHISYPVVMDLCFGHTRPQWLLPFNGNYYLNTISHILNLRQI